MTADELWLNGEAKTKECSCIVWLLLQNLLQIKQVVNHLEKDDLGFTPLPQAKRIYSFILVAGSSAFDAKGVCMKYGLLHMVI